MPLSEPVLQEIGEFDLIDLLAGDSGRDTGAIVGIGDDAAAFEVPAGRAVVTTCDSQVEGVHFRRDRIQPEDVGWRAVAVNLSDLAAMGAEPNFIIVSLALPADLEVSWIRSVYAGIAEINREFAISTIGGNISGTVGPIVIDVTAFGSCEPSELTLRSGARAGDCVVVTGAPGWSALGLALSDSPDAGRIFERDQFLSAHHRPKPRCKEGRIAADTGLVHAMIDVSDGVLADLGHVCEQSQLGAEIDVDALPMNERFVDVALRLGLDPVELVLGGGEDYELLMAVPPSNMERLAAGFKQSKLAPLYRIGEFTEAPGVRIPKRPDWPRGAGGFTHF